MFARLRALAIRIFASFFKRGADEALDDELQSHLEMAIEWNLRQGLTPEQARVRALADFGGVERTRQNYRDQRGLPMLETTLQDLRYGFRMLAANRSFTAMAVASLALGIGANTAIFSLLYALLLRPLPVPASGELVQVMITVDGRQSDSFSYPMIRALADRKDVFASLGGYSGATLRVGPQSAAARTSGAWVSGGFFTALRLTPAAGRLLSPDDDQPGAPLAAVLTDAFWDRAFQRNPAVVGSTLLIEGQPATVIGVTPRGFTGANVGEVADITMTFQSMAQLFPDRQGLLQAGNHYNRILARRAPGVSFEQARAMLKVIWPPMAEISVGPNAPTKRRVAMLASTLDLAPGGTGWTPLRNQYSKPLYILMVTSALVLLLACTNVANLLLARSTARRREFAIRLAIGAGRARLIRQLLLESLLLAAIGAALGLLLAQFGSRLLLAEVSKSIQLDVGLNLPVLGFTMTVSTLVGLLFGLAPALRATSRNQTPALRTTKESGQSRGRLTWILVTVQVVLSLLLLIVAGLFTRSLRNILSVDPGFRHESVLMADIDVRGVIHGEPDSASTRGETLFREGLEAISGLRGVSAVALSNFTPVSGGFWSQAVAVNGQATGDEPAFFAISPGYFAALGIPVRMGSDFSKRDVTGAAPVAVVNEEFVRRYLRELAGNPLGQVVSASDSRFWKNMEIVGVAANSAVYSLRAGARPCVYVPFFQQSPERIRFGTFEVRTQGSPSALSADLIRTLGNQFPGATPKVRTFTSQVEDSIRPQFLVARLAGSFGILALTLAAVGLYGLIAYCVAQRTSEVGIRMALGAEPNAVVRMMLASGMRPVAAGIAAGLPIAWWACRFVSAEMLYGLEPFDPMTISIAALTLALVTLAAGLWPASRAAKVDPVVALRQE